MYEDRTYEELLRLKLARVSNKLDKREGSIIYDAIAPNAYESAIMYTAIDEVLTETFADTAERPYLIKRAAERGLSPHPATYAVGVAEFDVAVQVGTRFSCGGYHWTVTESVGDGQYGLLQYHVICETAGEGPNASAGTMVSIDYVEGLTHAELTEIVIPGEDEEDTEVFRARYFSSMDSQAFSGNEADYKEKTVSIGGVGGVKVTPVWNGGGTVKLTIISSTFGVPSETLIQTVQHTIDPQQDGKGKGLAPIGHIVTVDGAQATTVDIVSGITYQTGWTWDTAGPYIKKEIDAYFAELAAQWADSETVVVRVSQLEARLLSANGVLDVSGTTLNGVAGNLELDEWNIPVRGTFNGNE